MQNLKRLILQYSLPLALVVLALHSATCATRQTVGNRLQRSIPDWAKGNTASKKGQELEIVCAAAGPSIDQARAHALQRCKASAMEFLRSDTTVQGVTIESESSVTIHQEVRSTAHYKGLSCKPIQDEVSTVEGGSFEMWLKCGFDLSKVQETSGPEAESHNTMNAADTREDQADRTGLVRQRQLEMAPAAPVRSATSNHVIDIVSIPPCESLVIRGIRARPLRCAQNGVTSVAIDPGDKEIIVRAPGYISKTFKLTPGNQRHETVQVILDPAN